MPSFAVVAEGITDQIILDRMIEIVCRDHDVEVNFLQPIRDATDRQGSHGGWELVLEYCRHRANDALVANDYLVIQIDTDCGEEKGFGIELRKDGCDRPQVDIISDTIQVIIACLGEEFFQENRDNIIFAISVHSLESWLLLLIFKQEKIFGSFKALERNLSRYKDFSLDKTAHCYEELSHLIERKVLMKQVGAPGSLGTFLEAVAQACDKEEADADECDAPTASEMVEGDKPQSDN